VINKILIIGAAGKSGLQVTKQALERGLEVRVLVRNPEKLGELKSKVEVVQGEATDSEKLRQAVADINAVVTVIGHGKNSNPGMQVEASQKLITAMKNAGVSRLISLTGAGVRAESDQPKLIDNVMVGLMNVFAKKAIQDGINHAKIIQQSDLSWTIVRSPMLTDGEGQGRYQVGLVGDKQISAKITRSDLAGFILDILADEKYFGKMPAVSN
jgi:putative NADH-flavin reductase